MSDYLRNSHWGVSITFPPSATRPIYRSSQRRGDIITQVPGSLGMYYGTVNATYVAYHRSLFYSPDFASSHQPPYLHHNTCPTLTPVEVLLRICKSLFNDTNIPYHRSLIYSTDFAFPPLCLLYPQTDTSFPLAQFVGVIRYVWESFSLY